MNAAKEAARVAEENRRELEKFAAEEKARFEAERI